MSSSFVRAWTSGGIAVGVLVVMTVPGDTAQFESFAAANKDRVEELSEKAKAAGCIGHRFAVGDGQIIVVDEWDSEESFQGFFDSQPEIPKVMQEVATGEPQISFYRPLETGDDF